MERTTNAYDRTAVSVNGQSWMAALQASKRFEG
jgi:hypothetical protein